MYGNNINSNLKSNSTRAYFTESPHVTVIGKIFAGILLIVIFEGAFRKWISISFTNPLVLLRDLMAVYGIFWAIKNNRLKLTQLGTKILCIWSVCLLIWGLFQLIINQNSILIYLIGMRFWLLYLWFSYAAALSLTERDFYFIEKIILILLLVMVPLTIMQHFSPPSSFLNKQVGDDESEIFLVASGIVRTTGTFSFTTGNTTFLAFAAPFALALLTSRKKLWRFKWMPEIFVLALGIGTMVSGSRSAFVVFAMLFFIYLLASIIYSKGKKRGSTLIILIITILMLSLIPLLFSRAFEANQERVETAAESENTTARVAGMFSFGSNSIDDISLIGYGFGAGTNFAGKINKTKFSLGETEMARTIMEAGIFGFIYFFLKIFIIIFGLLKSLLIIRKFGNSLPFMLWITTGIAFFTWSITLQLTVNTFGFLLLGLAVSSLRLFSRKPQLCI